MRCSFGGICTAVGHFPVFFRGSKDGDFSVDREAQAKVTDDMNKFLGDNGGLLLFPEGQVRLLQRLRCCCCFFFCRGASKRAAKEISDSLARLRFCLPAVVIILRS